MNLGLPVNGLAMGQMGVQTWPLTVGLADCHEWEKRERKEIRCPLFIYPCDFSRGLTGAVPGPAV